MNKQYEGAYYLGGYVVECGLKACIAEQTRRYDFPDKNTVNASYKHTLTSLVGVAGLTLVLDQEMKDDLEFANNWAVVKDWLPESRYKKHTRKDARSLYSAITNKKHGVLRWIKQHW